MSAPLTSLLQEAHVAALVHNIPCYACTFHKNYFTPSSQSVHNWILAYNLLRCTKGVNYDSFLDAV